MPADNNASTSHPGASAPLGATVTPGRRQFQRVLQACGSWSSCSCSMTPNARKPTRIISLRVGQASHVSLLACVCARRPAGPGVRVTGLTARSRRTAGFGSTARRCCSTLTVSPSPCPERYDRWAAARPGDNTAVAMSSVVADPDPLRLGGRSSRSTVRSRRPSSTSFMSRDSPDIPARRSSRAKRGTYAGLIDKIPYLKDLGVTAVELLPVFQFDARMRPPAW